MSQDETNSAPSLATLKTLEGYERGSTLFIAQEPKEVKTKQLKIVSDTAKPPAFPFHALPHEMQSLIELSYDHMNFPPEMTAAGIMSAISASIGNSLRFRTPIHGFDAKPILWLGIIAPRGSRKTPAINATLKPVSQHNNTALNEHRKKLKEWEATDQKDNKPEFFSSVINDSTLEGIIKACEMNERGVLTFSDELGGMIGNFGRYSGGADMDGYNTLWNGITTIYNRKKASLSMYAENPFWTLIGSLQPSRINDQFGRAMIESGFLDRFQFVYPTGTSYQDQTHEPPEELSYAWAQYNEGIAGLIQQAEFIPDKYIRAENPQTWMLYYNILGRKQNEVSDSDPLRGLAAKAQTMFARFSVIVHGLNVAFNGKNWLDNLTAEETRSANFLTMYFLESGLYTYNQMKQASPVDELPGNLMELYKSLPDEYELTRNEIIKQNETLTAKKRGYNKPSDSTLDRFIKNREFFKRVSYGRYYKLH